MSHRLINGRIGGTHDRSVRKQSEQVYGTLSCGTWISILLTPSGWVHASVFPARGAPVIESGSWSQLTAGPTREQKIRFARAWATDVMAKLKGAP